jgi:hypothetical protein
MNADVPPLKVLVSNKNLTQNEEADGYEAGYAFAIQSYKGRALHFHVLFQSGAHFRHIPLHWLIHEPGPFETHDLELLQLWDCFSFKPVVTVFDFLRDYQCDAILKDKTVVPGEYWFTIDWLPDSNEQPGILLQPDQNKCAHVVLLGNGQIACLPTNRIAFKDAYFVGNKPNAGTKGYVTIDTQWSAENADRWSVANTDETYY